MPLDQQNLPDDWAVAADDDPEEGRRAKAAFERNKAWTKPGARDFTTTLSPAEEKKFQAWVKANDIPNDDSPQADYDMRGYWKASQDPKTWKKLQTEGKIPEDVEPAGTKVDPNDGKPHYPDWWKTPFHETFSNESQWADPAKAPKWNAKDQLVGLDGKVLFDDRDRAKRPDQNADAFVPDAPAGDQFVPDPPTGQARANPGTGAGANDWLVPEEDGSAAQPGAASPAVPPVDDLGNPIDTGGAPQPAAASGAGQPAAAQTMPPLDELGIGQMDPKTGQLPPGMQTANPLDIPQFGANWLKNMGEDWRTGFADKPGYTYGQVLPYATNQQTGAVEWGHQPEWGRQILRGLGISPLQFDITNPQQRADVGAATFALAPALFPAMRGGRFPAATEPPAGPKPRVEPPPVGGGPTAGPDGGPSPPPSGGPGGAASELDDMWRDFKRKHGYDPRTEDAPKAEQPLGPATLDEPAPPPAASETPAPALEQAKPEEFVPDEPEKAKPQAEPEKSTRVTFFDQNRGEYATGTLVGVRPDGIYVVDQAAGAYTLVHPGSVVDTREVTAAPTADEPAGPDSTNTPPPTENAGQQGPGKSGPTAAAGGETAGAGADLPAGAPEKPQPRTVSEIQAEDGVPLGTAVQTHEAEKLAAETPPAVIPPDGEPPPEDLKSAHEGPWETAGKNAEGETVYRNPKGRMATFDAGVPWLGAADGSDDDNERLKVVEPAEGKTKGKTKGETKGETPESEPEAEVPKARPVEQIQAEDGVGLGTAVQKHEDEKAAEQAAENVKTDKSPDDLSFNGEPAGEAAEPAVKPKRETAKRPPTATEIAAEQRPPRTGAERPSYWMNEPEIDEAIDRWRDDPLLGPTTRWLGEYRDAVNRNSDGWPHWGGKVAETLMGLIQQADPRFANYFDKRGRTIFPNRAEIKAAVAPIKAFATKHNLKIPDFELEAKEAKKANADDEAPPTKLKPGQKFHENPDSKLVADTLRDGDHVTTDQGDTFTVTYVGAVHRNKPEQGNMIDVRWDNGKEVSYRPEDLESVLAPRPYFDATGERKMGEGATIKRAKPGAKPESKTEAPAAKPAAKPEEPPAKPEWKMTLDDLDPAYRERRYGDLSLTEFLRQAQLHEAIGAANDARSQTPQGRKAAFERGKRLFRPGGYIHMHPDGQKPPTETPQAKPAPAPEPPSQDDTHPASHDWSVKIADTLRDQGQAKASEMFNALADANNLTPAQREKLLTYTRGATDNPDWTPTPSPTPKTDTKARAGTSNAPSALPSAAQESLAQQMNHIADLWTAQGRPEVAAEIRRGMPGNLTPEAVAEQYQRLRNAAQPAPGADAKTPPKPTRIITPEDLERAELFDPAPDTRDILDARFALPDGSMIAGSENQTHSDIVHALDDEQMKPSVTDFVDETHAAQLGMAPEDDPNALDVSIRYPLTPAQKTAVAQYIAARATYNDAPVMVQYMRETFPVDGARQFQGEVAAIEAQADLFDGAAAPAATGTDRVEVVLPSGRKISLPRQMTQAAVEIAQAVAAADAQVTALRDAMGTPNTTTLARAGNEARDAIFALLQTAGKHGTDVDDLLVSDPFYAGFMGFSEKVPLAKNRENAAGMLAAFDALLGRLARDHKKLFGDIFYTPADQPAAAPTPDLQTPGENAISETPEAEDGDRTENSGVDQAAGGGSRPSRSGTRKPKGNRPSAPLEPGSTENAAPTGRSGDGGEAGVRPGSEEVGGTPAVHSGGDAATGRGGTGDTGVVPDGAGGRTANPAVTRPNFHIDDPKRIIGGSGPKQRFARNRAALRALEDIQAEGRDPTQEELETMAGFIGWGSFGQEVFQGSFERQPYREGWEEEGRWLREHLGREAWESARDSIRNAHYTDPPTVAAMWDMVRHMGFRGGRVLEPSMGVGNFFGMMPRDLMGQSDLTGIEKEKTTGEMAKLLYPHAGIHVKGYEESKTADNFYDLVIGNWPFAQQSPPDRRYDRLSPALHNYFFLKALDQVRPGGLVVGITSNGTMDSVGRAARLEMAKKGKLIAAFRLPSGAFKDYAGTNVVADIIILQKRAEPLANAVDEPWIDATEMSTEHGDIRVNQYFQDHPQNVLGTLDWGHGTTSGRPGMIVHRPDDLEERLQALPATLPTDAYQPVMRGREPRFLINNTKDRQGNIVIADDGHLYQVQGERLARLDDLKSGMTTGSAKVVKAREDQVRRMIGMRKTYGALIDAERDGKPEADTLRKSLKAQYDQFRAAHGPIGKSDGLRVLDRMKDPARSAVESLERPDGTPSPILTEPTVRSRRNLENPSIADAFVLARNEQANFDLDRVAELTGKPRNAVEDVLLDQGAILRTPGGGFQATDDYLSGNVRRKLREAKDALAAGDAKMQPSIDALTKVLPPDTPYYNIEAKLGATWVGDDAYRAFIGDLLALTPDQRAAVDVRFAGSRWKVRFNDRSINRKAEARTVHGHEDYPFNQLMMAAMGNRSIRLTYKDADGNDHLDEKATEEVNAKVQDLKDKFTDWAWSDPERKLAFEQAFNESMNAIAKPHFDGSFMDLSGMALRRGNDPFSLRRHQINAIWRAVVLGRGLFAHEVGTGKSYTMAGVAVEGRRYGKFRKPVVFAHNANSAAVAQEFQDMYPGGKFFYISQLKPDEIATSLRRIANEDWDAVIMPHSLIDRMALTKPTLMALAAEQIAELENAAIEAAAEDDITLTPEEIYSLIEASKTDKKAMGRLRSPTAKDVVRQIQTLLNNIEKQANRASQEDAVPFEQLGIDAILVDEAHEFKKPPFATAMKMRGLNKKASDRSIALDFLTKYVKANNAGKGVFLFTGTPVTNTLNEIFNMARYFMDDRMEEAGIKEWDAWFNTFADATNDIELTSTGEIEPVKRLAAFNNVDELVRQMSEFVDVVQAKDMPEFKPRPTPSGKTLTSPDLTPEELNFLMNGRTLKPEGRPYIKVVTDVGEMSPAQVEILDELRELAREFKAADGKQKKEWMQQGDERVPIRIETNSANTGIDPRLYNPDAPDTEDSKINRIVRNVLRHYGEPDAAQAIFLDRGFNPVKSSEGRASRFVVVDELIKKLVEGGIPRDQIAVVAGGMKAEKKKEIADGMNSGKYRIAIGQSGTLGVGVNMQQRLRAIHHFDAPWRPGDLEQRNGRMNRQGNTWNMAYEYRYVTEGIDGRRWQVLQVKDKFIKAFIAAFNDTSGKRIGNIEGDAADMAEEEDFSKTLSAAAGDPRIMIRAKYKADVDRLQRRERLHTRGQAEAIQLARDRRVSGERLQQQAAEQGRYADRWEASVDRAAKAAEADGDDRKWYEIDGDEAQAAAKIADLDTKIAGLDDQISKARKGLQDLKDEGKPFGHVERRLDRLIGAKDRAQAAIESARSTGRWFDTGSDLQDALDKAIAQVARGEKRKLATVGGFDIVGNWSSPFNLNEAPRIEIYDPPSGQFVDWVTGLTVLRIANELNQRRQKQQSWATEAAEKIASIPALEAAGKQDFPQQEKLTKVRQQLAALEDDLQTNPNPPPSWLRNGAPMDTDIYVDGEPRTVRGHRVADDYFLVTDEGEVPYLAAMDANGLRIFTVHEPPQVVSREAPDWVKPHLEATRGVSEGDPYVWHGELVWHNRDLALIKGTTNLWGPDETTFVGFKKGMPAEPGRNHIGMMTPRGFKPQEWERLGQARDDYLSREANRAALDATAKPVPASAFSPTRGLDFNMDRGADDADRPVRGLPRGGLAEDSGGISVPLYSAVQRAADGLKQAKGTGQQMLAQITKAPGVKPEEIEWMGLDDWLKGQPSVTKQQIQDFVAANRLDVREVHKGGAEARAALLALEPELRALGIKKELGEISSRDIADKGGSDDLLDRFWDALEQSTKEPPKYASWLKPFQATPNYREVVFTLPPSAERQVYNVVPHPSGTGFAIQRGNGSFITQGPTTPNPGAPTLWDSRESAEHYGVPVHRAKDRQQGGDYLSGHWHEPNVVAHARIDEFTAPDGARVLMVHEVQSDWHQKGRREGYIEPPPVPEKITSLPAGYSVIKFPTGFLVTDPDGRHMTSSAFQTQDAAVADTIDRLNELEADRAQRPYQGDRVPNAPFKTTWPALVMKRMIKFAVDNGFDRVAWSPGELHADRYNLSKHISRVEYDQSPNNPEGGNFKAFDQDGFAVINRYAKTAELPDIIGKAAADKLLARNPEGDKITQASSIRRTLRGLDLKVGGEGMTGFYDDILPRTVQKIVGKYGAKVGRSEVRGGPEADAYEALNRGQSSSVGDRSKAFATVHSFDITPALRDAVQTEGMALFERKPGGADTKQTWATPLAGDIGGTVAWENKGLALIRGHSLNGKRIYVPAKEGIGRASVDIDSYTGKHFTPDELARLRTARDKVAAADVAALTKRQAASKRVSPWPDGGMNFTDLLFEAPEQGHGEAGDWTRQKGIETHHEHIAVVDNATGRIVHAGTNNQRREVDFPHANIARTNNSVTLHHNHPNNTGQSRPDIVYMANPGVSHMVVHGHDGSTSIASLGANAGFVRTADEVAANAKTLGEAYDRADATARQLLRKRVTAGDVSEEVAGQFRAEVTNRLLDAEGITNYVSTRELPPAIKLAVEQTLKDLGYDKRQIDRSTRRVRPEERVASLPRPVRGGSGPGRKADGGRGKGLSGGQGQADVATPADQPSRADAAAQEVAGSDMIRNALAWMAGRASKPGGLAEAPNALAAISRSIPKSPSRNALRQ